MPAIAKVTLSSGVITPNVEGGKFSTDEITKVFRSFVGGGFVEATKKLEEEHYRSNIFKGKVLDFEGNLDIVSVFVVGALEKHLWKLTASLLESPSLRFNLELTVLLEEGETFALQIAIVADTIFDQTLIDGSTELHLETQVFIGDLISQLNITPFVKDPKPNKTNNRPVLTVVR